MSQFLCRYDKESLLRETDHKNHNEKRVLLLSEKINNLKFGAKAEEERKMEVI